MAIPVGQLQFGEADAKNELFQQERYGSTVFRNSFLTPPGVDMDELALGARFFIFGQKGCGKTALLLNVERDLAEAGANTHIVLFKSGMMESERSKLSTGANVEILHTDSGIKVEYEYTVNWLWMIYRNLLRLVRPEDLISDVDTLIDLQKLCGVYKETKSSSFGDLALSRVKGAAKAGLAAGPFKGEIGGEVEAARAGFGERGALEIIEIIERHLGKIKTRPKSRALLFFDELELFWNREDQRERDLFLIRDLLQSVARVNRVLGSSSATFVVYASVRSEVLEEINRVGPEIAREITDFGIHVNWNVKASSAEQPILQIVEAKIQASEIEYDEHPSDDPWGNYLPSRVFGRDTKEYLLDVSMFKPRNLVNILNLAKKYNSDADHIDVAAFEQTGAQFSQATWREIEEELLATYSRKEVSNIKAIFTGFKTNFSIFDLEDRIAHLVKFDPTLSQGFRSRTAVIELCKSLYRVGACGNSFSVPGAKGLEQRDRWSFRDMGEPAIDTTFVVHESLRKVFQMSFVD